MTHNPKSDTTAQADDCDCMICLLRRAMQSKYQKPLTMEQRIDICEALGYHAGVATASHRDLGEAFVKSFEQAQHDWLFGRSPRSTH